MKTASEMTYIVSSGALNSTPNNDCSDGGIGFNECIKIRVILLPYSFIDFFLPDLAV